MALLAALISTTIDLLARALQLMADRGGGRTANLRGRRRAGVAPVAIFTCTLLMGLGALQVLHDAAIELLRFVLYNAEPGAPLHLVQLDVCLLLAAMLLAAAIQASALWTHEGTSVASDYALHAFAQSGLAFVACVATQLRASWWLFDASGALLISILCVIPWARRAVQQVQMLVDKETDAHVGTIIRQIAHKHGVVLDMLHVFRSGPAANLFVSLDVALPQETILHLSRTIADSLQREIEALAIVERCFVQISRDLIALPLRDCAHHSAACDVEHEPVELSASDSQLFSLLVYKLRELSEDEEDQLS
jgi:divalent metal cation (Fe/Co/Zn/Cd) transporter